MKKFYSIFAVIAAAASVNAQNLVTNPSFENGQSGWTKGFPSSYTDPTIVSGGAQDGTMYAAYNAPSGTTGFYQTVPVTGGTQYTLSFWYKASGDDTDARLWSNFKDAAGGVLYLAAVSSDDPLRTNNIYLPTSTVWKNHKVTFIAPSTAVAMDVAVRAYSNSNVAFDNFMLVAGTLSVSNVNLLAKEFIKNTVATSTILFGAKSDVKIYSLSGQLVKSASVNAGTSLDVSSLAKGIYIVTGEVNGQKVSQKIIKN